MMTDLYLHSDAWRKNVSRPSRFALSCALLLSRHATRPIRKERAMTQAMQERTATAAKAVVVDTKLEVVVIPVSDVDRAKAFYASLGWRLDADFAGEGWRVIQFTPPGSPTSVIFGNNVTPAAPGSAQGLYLVVSDIEAARKDLIDRGIKVSEAFHAAGDAHVGKDAPYLFGSVRQDGRDP